MARYRRMNMAIRPVQRIKHIVDDSATISAGTGIPIILVRAVDAPVIANTPDVITGSKVNGIFLNVQVESNQDLQAAIPNIYIAVYKNPGGLVTTHIDPRSTGDDVNKKLIIHQEMSFFEPSIGGNPKTIFKGVIVIPKGMRRFGAADELIMTIASTAINFKYCLQCIYKEFR